MATQVLDVVTLVPALLLRFAAKWDMPQLRSFCEGVIALWQVRLCLHMYLHTHVGGNTKEVWSEAADLKLLSACSLSKPNSQVIQGNRQIGCTFPAATCPSLAVCMCMHAAWC